jgi:hypothetical protein
LELADATIEVIEAEEEWFYAALTPYSALPASY